MADLDLKVGDVYDTPSVTFRSSGVIYEPSPAPTAHNYLPDGTDDELTLTQIGSGVTARFLVEDFTPLQAGQYIVEIATTDGTADFTAVQIHIAVDTPWITRAQGSAADVWNYLVTSLGTDTTKVGALFLSLLNAIKGKTDALSPTTVVVSSPVTADGNLDMVQGDDYKAADGRALTFTYTGQPSFIGATHAALRFSRNKRNDTDALNFGTDDSPVYEITGSFLNATQVQFEMTSAQSALLPVDCNLYFEVELTLSNNDIITPSPLNRSSATIRAQALPPS